MKRQPSRTVVATAALLVAGGVLVLFGAWTEMSLILRYRPGWTPLQVLWRNFAPFVRMLVGAVWLCVTGYGLLRLRPWGRISLFTLCVSVLCFGGFFQLTIYFWSDASPLMGDVALLVPSAMLSAAVFLVLFTRKSIANQFTGGQERPVSVAMLGGFFLASTVFVEMALTGQIQTHPSYFLIGIPVKGIPALVILALWLILLVVLGVALLKWRAWARIPSAIYASLYLVDCAYAFLPGRAERFATSVPLTRGPNLELAALAQLVKGISLWFAAWAAVALWILADNWSEFERNRQLARDNSAGHREDGGEA